MLNIITPEHKCFLWFVFRGVAPSVYLSMTVSVFKSLQFASLQSHHLRSLQGARRFRFHSLIINFKCNWEKGPLILRQSIINWYQLMFHENVSYSLIPTYGRYIANQTVVLALFQEAKSDDTLLEVKVFSNKQGQNWSHGQSEWGLLYRMKDSYTSLGDVWSNLNKWLEL